MRHHLLRNRKAEPFKELVLVFDIVGFHQGLDGDAELLGKPEEGIAFLNDIGLRVDLTGLAIG